MEENIIKEVILKKVLLTEDDLSLYWGVKKHTLQKWRSTGDGPKYYKIGGHIRYPLKYVLKYQKERFFNSTSSRVADDDAGGNDEK